MRDVEGAEVGPDGMLYVDGKPKVLHHSIDLIPKGCRVASALIPPVWSTA
ncbi:hypothetical protein AB0E10_42960 [Streptomyces sp. NPDC048045]